MNVQYMLKSYSLGPTLGFVYVVGLTTKPSVVTGVTLELKFRTYSGCDVAGTACIVE